VAYIYFQGTLLCKLPSDAIFMTVSEQKFGLLRVDLIFGKGIGTTEVKSEE
jgi:hypothetical protein